MFTTRWARRSHEWLTHFTGECESCHLSSISIRWLTLSASAPPVCTSQCFLAAAFILFFAFRPARNFPDNFLFEIFVKFIVIRYCYCCYVWFCIDRIALQFWFVNFNKISENTILFLLLWLWLRLGKFVFPWTRLNKESLIGSGWREQSSRLTFS